MAPPGISVVVPRVAALRDAHEDGPGVGCPPEDDRPWPASRRRCLWARWARCLREMLVIMSAWKTARRASVPRELAVPASCPAAAHAQLHRGGARDDDG